MEDLRKKHRIPFGYRIVDGAAQVDPVESARLKMYFSRYLGGETMAEAAREAGLTCCPTTLRNLLKRKEYAGTDYYPAIITSDYQKRLESEWEKRKGEKRIVVKEAIPKGVRIYTDFIMGKKGIVSDDPAEQAASLYQQIRPRYKKAAASHM